MAQQLGFPVNYSAGISTSVSVADTLDAMLKRADANLYGAKHQGRARTLDAEGISVHGRRPEVRKLPRDRAFNAGSGDEQPV